MSIAPRTSEQDLPNSDGDPLANFTTTLLENTLDFFRQKKIAVVAGSLLSEAAEAYAREDTEAFWVAANAYNSTELVDPLPPLSPQALARIRELGEASSIVEAKLDFRNSNHRAGVVRESIAEDIFGD